MRTVLCLALATSALAGAAHASSASAHASVVITEAAGIDVLSDLVLPTIVSTVSVGGGASTSLARSPYGNAALTIHGKTGDTLSMALPASFEVVRSGGTEGLTVKTTTDTDLHLTDGVVLGGNDLADGTMSIKVGALVALATAQNASPGPYEGTLVVLVQYN